MTKTESLPFVPESWISLRNRLPIAVDYVFDIYQMTTDHYYGNKILRAGEDRCFVFDCTNGIRLIISREQLKGKTSIHVSASAHESLAKKLLRMPPHRVPKELIEQAQAAAFFIMQGVALPNAPDVWTPNGVPHWFLL